MMFRFYTNTMSTTTTEGTSLEEVDRLPPPLVLGHRQGRCDVAPQSIEARFNDFRIARVQNVILKAPVLASLQTSGHIETLCSHLCLSHSLV